MAQFLEELPNLEPESPCVVIKPLEALASGEKPKVVTHLADPVLPTFARVSPWFLLIRSLPARHCRIHCTPMESKIPKWCSPSHFFGSSWHTVNQTSPIMIIDI